MTPHEADIAFVLESIAGVHSVFVLDRRVIAAPAHWDSWTTSQPVFFPVSRRRHDGTEARVPSRALSIVFASSRSSTSSANAERSGDGALRGARAACGAISKAVGVA